MSRDEKDYGAGFLYATLAVLLGGPLLGYAIGITINVLVNVLVSP